MANNANYDKLDLLAELIDPMGEILTDREALLCWKAGRKADGLRLMIVNHKAAIVEILARLEGEDPASYRIDGGALLLKLIAKWNELQEMAEVLFPSRAQSADAAYSGPVTDATREGES